MRVLITRPEPDATETARKLEALGFEPVVLPLTETRPVALDAGVVPPPFDAVAVTSANAIRHAPSELLARLAKKSCFAVGKHTADAARSAGIEDVVQGTGDAENLAKLMAERLSPGARILYLCGRVRRPEFEAALADSGFAVAALEVYDTVEAARLSDVAMRLTDMSRLDAALLYSVKGAQALAQLAGRAELAKVFEDARYFCLSKRVAEAFGGVSRQRVFVSQRPSEDSLMELLGHVLAT